MVNSKRHFERDVETKLWILNLLEIDNELLHDYELLKAKLIDDGSLDLCRALFNIRLSTN